MLTDLVPAGRLSSYRTSPYKAGIDLIGLQLIEQRYLPVVTADHVREWLRFTIYLQKRGLSLPRSSGARKSQGKPLDESPSIAAWGNYPELVGLTLRSHGRCAQKPSLRKTLFHKGFSKSRRCPSSDYIPGDNGNKFLYHLVAHRSTTAVTTLSSAKTRRFPCGYRVARHWVGLFGVSSV